MDRKSIIILAASFGLLFLWFWIVPKMYPPIPKPRSTNATAIASDQLPPTNVPAPPIPPPQITESGAVLQETFVPPGTPEQVEKLETSEAIYTFTSHGGGLKLVELKQYKESVACGRRKPATNQLASLNTLANVPVMALRGSEALTGDAIFELTRSSATTIRAQKVLTNGLVVIKDFTVASNHLVHVKARLENRSEQPVTLPERSWTAGTATTMGPQDDPRLLGVYYYNGTSDEHVDPGWFENRKFCMAGTPRQRFTAGAGDIHWTAVHNQFFALAVWPTTNQIASQVLVRRIDLPPFPGVPAGKSEPHFGYEANLVYSATNLAPRSTLERGFTIYAGPKEYKTLARLGHNLDLIMGYSGFFGWFAKALLLSMNGLYHIVPNYGIAIILITIIIKILFWPLTQASTKSMKRMQALQPQMKALQEKYRDDPAKMNKKLMEFMKENKVSPLGGCLPMLLQIPVFFGFFRMIQSAIELRGVRFLWACDLSRPDTIAVIPGLDWIPLLGVAGVGLPINPLPLIMGVTMLWQARMTPAAPGADPMQQKIMKYMPMMFVLFLYNFSAGLTLYWTVQNLLTIAQMKLTKTQDTPKAGPPAPAPAQPSRKKR